MLFTSLRLPLMASSLALLLCACTGAIRSPDESRPGAVIDPGDGADAGPKPSSADSARPPEPGNVDKPSVAFVAPSDSLQLLPFDVRLTKLANVLGVTTDDAVFAEMRAQRRDLGGYDYAQGIAPDLSWSAKRIAGWIKALRPVCDGAAMKGRYPTITGEVDELVMRAHGRRASDDDRSDLAGVPTSLDGAGRYRAMCIGFLSSTEFVAP